MGTIADSLFTVLMSWVRALVNAIWALFSADSPTLLAFLGQHWLAIALVIVVVGLVVDRLVWLIRWRPYHLLAMRLRRRLGIDDPEDEDGEDEDVRLYAPPQREPEPAQEDEQAWFPQPPVLDERDEREAIEAAESAPDERQYPGMRYDSQAAAAPETELEGTRRYAAVHAEGPGAAEVNRRRAEIDAWQLQMQEEARQRAEAERAAREAEQQRLAQEAYEAEQQRLAQEAYEAEQQRLAQEAYEAEQQRLEQEEYERQLAEYERQKAQYERDLAEYERQKAEYDAAVARQNADIETAQEPAPAPARRRRRTNATYSDYVAGEDVGELPDPPAWTRMEKPRPAPAPAPSPEPAPEKPEKRGLLRGGMERMAKLMEDEQDEIRGIASLPPRVDPGKAYRPAKKPPKA